MIFNLISIHKLLTYCLPLACAIFLVSCGSDDMVDSRQNNGSTICDYAPYATGSIFSFERTNPAPLPDYDVIVRGDTIIDGEDWKIIDEVAGERYYVNCRNDQIVSRANKVPPQLSVSVFDFISLKLNAPPGTKWIQEYPSRDGRVLRYTHKIIETNGKRTVNKMDFEEVIMVNQIIQIVSFSPDDTVTVDVSLYWYAPNAGLIESEVDGGLRLTDFDLE